MYKCATYFIMLFLISSLQPLQGQKEGVRLALIDKRLNILIEEGAHLGKPVTISLTGKIQELVSFLAESTNTSIAINSSIRRQVSVTFNKVPVNDILLYLCDNYKLDIQPTGGIINLVEYVVPPPKPKIHEPDITYNASSGLIQMNLRRDTLAEVARKISQISGQSVAVDPIIHNRRVSGFVNNLTIEQALGQLAKSNNLEISFADGYYLLNDLQAKDLFGEADGGDSEVESTGNRGRQSSNNQIDNVSNISIRKSSDNKINVRAENTPIDIIIKTVAEALQIDYYILTSGNTGRNTNTNTTNRNRERPIQTSVTPISGQLVSLQVKDVTFNELLFDVLKNSNYTFEYRRNTYIIGPRTAESLRTIQVFQFQYRSARGVELLIPENLRAGVVIDTLYELNSLILTGSHKNIEETTYFLHKIDQVVPVVMIELTIVDVQSDKLEEYGIEAGLVAGGRERGGQVISGEDPNNGANFTFSPSAINRVLGLLTGQSVINIGRVSQDFYLSLSALQADGLVDIQSTPRLSTLNSHPAIMSIGQKRYYQEQQVNFPGFDRPIPVQSVIFKEIEANLLIQILPFVSGDEQVTLEIQFEQSEFLEDTDLNAPPSQVSRRFESTIRVRNGETIILGGLERELKSKSKRGLPFLSRIPIIGALFGKHTNNKQKNKLLIIIKPTIVN